MQALKVTNNNHIANMGIGNIWLGRGDFQKARRHYEESLRIKPDYAEGHNNLALTLMREGRLDEATAHYREALKDNPDYAEAYNNLGAVLANQRKYREAEACFLRALKLKPDYKDARNNLSLMKLAEGRADAVLDLQ
jgi:protein O-GlcNAc transferase